MASCSRLLGGIPRRANLRRDNVHVANEQTPTIAVFLPDVRVPAVHRFTCVVMRGMIALRNGDLAANGHANVSMKRHMLSGPGERTVNGAMRTNVVEDLVSSSHDLAGREVKQMVRGVKAVEGRTVPDEHRTSTVLVELSQRILR